MVGLEGWSPFLKITLGWVFLTVQVRPSEKNLLVKMKRHHLGSLFPRVPENEETSPRVT